MTNDESLIYVLVSWVLHNVHFRHFGNLKLRFLLIRQRVLLIQWFWIYFCRDYIICIDHLFLTVNSDCKSSDTRIPHLMSCISMSNYESLIHVLVPWVFHNVLFRHFGELKMRFLFIRQRVLLRQWFWIHLSWDYKYLQRPPVSHVNSDF